MLRITLLIASAFALTACMPTHTASPRDTNTRTETPTHGTVSGRATYDRAIPIAGEPYLLTPFAVRGMPALFQDRDPYTNGGVASYSDSLTRVSSVSSAMNVRWHNAIITDLSDNSQHAILSRRGIIGQYYPLATYDRNKEQHTAGLIFLAVIDDTNKDGQMNDQDARVALASRINGANVQVISPANGQVWSMQYDPSYHFVYLQVALDTNSDGRFSFDDTAVPYMWGVDWDKPAVPVLDDAIRSRVESMLK